MIFPEILKFENGSLIHLLPFFWLVKICGKELLGIDFNVPVLDTEDFIQVGIANDSTEDRLVPQSVFRRACSRPETPRRVITSSRRA